MKIYVDYNGLNLNNQIEGFNSRQSLPQFTVFIIEVSGYIKRKFMQLVQVNHFRSNLDLL